VALSTGYAQSKYIVERLALFAASHLNMPIRLLRVGQLCGNTITGHWSPDEMWPILFATCAKLGAVPNFPEKMVDWIPVDIAARSIVEILTRLQYPSSCINKSSGRDESSHSYTVHNIVNPHCVPWADVVTMLQDNNNITKGKKLRIVSMVEWVELLSTATDDGMSADELPGLRLLGFFEDMAQGSSQGKYGEESILFDTTRSQMISSALEACESFRAEWLERSIRRWKGDGFIGG
jgi:thioester reductase-like protein